MTVLLKALFFPLPLHNPPELAPAAPQGVGAFVCMCVYSRQQAKRGSVHVRGGVSSGGCGSLDGYISAGTK